MIHFAIGTKAQFIKMAPIMHLLQNEGLQYHLLDLSQHASLTGKILDDFNLSPRITKFMELRDSITTYKQALIWFANGIYQSLKDRNTIRKKFFLDQSGVVLVHGDTLSTVLGYKLAKAGGIPVALVEAGLTSNNLFNPFPEELVRRYVSKKSQYLFPPGIECVNWLQSKNYKAIIINTLYNTGRDSMNLVLLKNSKSPPVENTKGIATLHRLETLSNSDRLRKIINYIIEFSTNTNGLDFYLHPPTEHALKKFNLLRILEKCSYINIKGLEPYPLFVNSLMSAKYILTDGGSIQEEAFYLGKPCIILRDTTERNEGLGHNAFISSWSAVNDSIKLSNLAIPYMKFQYPEFHASKIIIESLLNYK